MIKARAKYQYEVFSDEMVLYAFVRNQYENKDYQVAITLKEKDLSALSVKAIDTDKIGHTELLQTIFDALWEGGMRPKGFADVKNETTAIKCHLEDMRKIVFETLGKPPFIINN